MRAQKVSVLQLSYDRPEYTKKTLSSILKCDIGQIFISIDGPPSGHLEIAKRVQQTKLASVNVAHDDQLIIRIRPINTGLRDAVESAIDWFFTQVEFGIIVEDDIEFHSNFIDYCNYFRSAIDHGYCATISGNNLIAHLFPDRLPPVYRLAQIFHCWGWASTKSVWKNYKEYLASLSSNQIAEDLTEKIRSKYFDSPAIQEFWKWQVATVERSQTKSWAYPFMVYCVAHDLRHLTPPCNLVTNFGFNHSATNTFGKPTYMEDISTNKDWIVAPPEGRLYKDSTFDILEYRSIIGLQI